MVELTRMEGTKHGQMIATQLLDVTIRVQAIRKYSVEQCALLLENASLFTGKQVWKLKKNLFFFSTEKSKNKLLILILNLKNEFQANPERQCLRFCTQLPGFVANFQGFELLFLN